MSLRYTPTAANFLTTIEGKNKDITDSLLSLLETTGKDIEVRYYQNILVINLGGLDIFGISPRKTKYSMYLFDLEAKHHFLPKLGKIDDGVGCLRFNKLADLNLDALKEMFVWMLEHPKNYYGNISDKVSQK